MKALSHFTTIVSRRPAEISSVLSSLHEQYRKHTLLFSLSSNAPDLADLVTRLTTFSDQSIGCLSAQLPFTDEQNLTCCSLGFFDSRYVTPFRSTIPGRAAPQVGRWHAFRRRSDSTDIDNRPFEENVNWEDVWNKSVNTEPLPSELQSIRSSKVKSVVYFSDDAPEGLLNSLQVLPNANKLGLIAASTPFVTGRPFTLFSNENIYSSGAVGIALTENISELHVDFPAALKPITSGLTITRSEGNLVHELDNSNATRILLTAIERAGVKNAKEDDFYLAVLDCGEIQQVYHISSGDPSRGTISLESHAAPAQGVQVQLCHLSRETSIKWPPVDRPSMQFLASCGSDTHVSARTGAGDGVILPDVFLAASENGFLVGSSKGTKLPWKCKVPGGLARFHWPADP